jgi:hypothetical protein
MTAIETTRAKNTPRTSRSTWVTLVLELLLLDRGDPLEDLQRVRGLLDLRLERTERDLVVVLVDRRGLGQLGGRDPVAGQLGERLAGSPGLGGEALPGWDRRRMVSTSGGAPRRA